MRPLISMINNVTPDHKFKYHAIAIGRFILCIATIFFIVFVYVRHGDWISTDWLSEAILFIALANVLWFYRVQSRWKFIIDEKEIFVLLTYNFFLRGVVTITTAKKRKTKYLCWLVKKVEILFHAEENDYILEIARRKQQDFFTCSIKLIESRG